MNSSSTKTAIITNKLAGVKMYLRFSLQNISFRKGFILSFALGFIVRLIPEVLSYPYPIGFDTVYYAARIKSGVVWYDWASVFSTWLLYAILIPFYRIVQVDPFLLLKLAAPTLYALNVCGVYYFAKKALNWETRKGLIAAFLFAFALAALRLSWDLYRDMLGMAILLFALPLIKNMKTKWDYAAFFLLSLLVVFSHELVSVIMFAVVFGVIMIDFMKDRRRMLKLLAVTSLPFGIFLMNLHLLTFSNPTNVINVYDWTYSSPIGSYFIVNYLRINMPIYHYPTYIDLVSQIFLLFCVLFLWWLPLICVGFFRDKILDCWSILLLIGSFDSLITPFFAVAMWERWMFILVYPFTFYAANGIKRISESKFVNPDLKWLGWMKVSKKTMLGIVLLTISLGSLFMAVRYGDGGVFCIPSVNSYFPSNMLQNSIPLQDVKSLVGVLKWMNERANTSSCVLVQTAFLWWADLYLNKYTIVYFTSYVKKALNVALENGYDHVYFVWWNENIGWYNITVPKYFVPTFSYGRISAFKYNISS